MSLQLSTAAGLFVGRAGGKLAALISVSIPPDKSGHYSEEAAIIALIGTTASISSLPRSHPRAEMRPGSSSRPPLLAQLASGVVGACASGRRSETYIEGGQTWRSSHDPTMQSAALVLGRFSLGSDF